MEVQNTCILCSVEDESQIHIFERCPFVQDCWRRVSLNLMQSNDLSFSNWVSSLVRSLNEEELCKFFFICWGIWNTRNSKLWENSTHSAQFTVDNAIFFGVSWREANADIILEASQQGKTCDGMAKTPCGLD